MQPTRIRMGDLLYLLTSSVLQQPDGRWKAVRTNGTVREFEEDQKSEAESWSAGGNNQNDLALNMNEHKREPVMRFPHHTSW